MKDKGSVYYYTERRLKFKSINKFIIRIFEYTEEKKIKLLKFYDVREFSFDYC